MENISLKGKSLLRICGSRQLYGSRHNPIVPYVFFTDILIIPSAFVMMLMIVARVWDALNDPMMGVIVDRTSTKYGKMRPYVLIGSFLMLVTTIVLFMPLTGAPTMFKMIFAAVSYIIFGMAYTLTDVPAMGLMSVATPSSDERASLLSFYVTVGSVGSLLPVGLLTIFQSFIPEKYVYFAMSIFVGIITSAAYLTLFKTQKSVFPLIPKNCRARYDKGRDAKISL